MPTKFSLEHASIKPGKPKKSREPIGELRPRVNSGWVTSLFCVKNRGHWGGEILSLWLQSQVRKQFKANDFSPWASTAKWMLWLIIILLVAELVGGRGAGGEGLTSHKCLGWPGEDEFFLLKLGCLQSTRRHLVSNPVRYIVMSKYLPLSTKQCRKRNILSFVTEVIKGNVVSITRTLSGMKLVSLAAVTSKKRLRGRLAWNGHLRGCGSTIVPLHNRARSCIVIKNDGLPF